MEEQSLTMGGVKSGLSGGVGIGGCFPLGGYTGDQGGYRSGEASGYRSGDVSWLKGERGI